MYVLFQGFVQESPALKPGAETENRPDLACFQYTDGLMLQLAGDSEAYIR